MPDILSLTRTELVAGRSFTDPEHTEQDLLALRRMAERLHSLLRQPEALPRHPRPLILNFQEEDGRDHRIVLSQAEKLFENDSLTVVGFFGCKTKEVDHAVLDEVDGELIGEFFQHPGILSYSSMMLANGECGNLVLLNPPEAKEHWRASERHAYAVQELAPKHYLNVRLHNGVLPGGVMGGSSPVLRSTKYYDYAGGTLWKAIREPG